LGEGKRIAQRGTAADPRELTHSPAAAETAALTGLQNATGAMLAQVRDPSAGTGSGHWEKWKEKGDSQAVPFFVRFSVHSDL
jgi:hypothetical protein